MIKLALKPAFEEESEIWGTVCLLTHTKVLKATWKIFLACIYFFFLLPAATSSNRNALFSVFFDFKKSILSREK